MSPRYCTTLLLALGLAVPHFHAGAQPRTVLLVHGLNSDGQAWQTGANRLKAEFPGMQFLAPTLGSFSEFTEQAVKLRAVMEYYRPSIVVGHSNGGTVLRTAAYQGEPMYGALTLGSPQQGAPLADRAVDGLLVGSLYTWWNDIVQPVSIYGEFGWDYISAFADRLGGRFSTYTNPWMNVLFQYFGISYATGRATDNVVKTMGTAGWANFTLNQPDNLARENERIPLRFSIMYRYNGPGVMWKGLTPQIHAQATTLQWVLADVYMANYEQYVWYDTYDDRMAPWKRAYAYLWAVGAYRLSTTDEMWCGLIDAWTSDGICDSDGIVPVRSMYWPGATPAATVVGLGHTEETSHATSMAAVAGVLRQNFGVQ